MYFLHAINSDRQTRLLNVLGRIEMILGDKKKSLTTEETHSSVTLASQGTLEHGMQKLIQPVSHLE